jgi:hypothetical protein
MTTIDVASNPVAAERALRKALGDEEQKPPPMAEAPSETVFLLAGGYLDLNGSSPVWEKEFEVRELTGRDEEVVGRIKDPIQGFISILERGLVRVGTTLSSRELVDGLLAGDWETVLVAIRVATFGRKYAAECSCINCTEQFTAEVDLLDDPPQRTVSVREDLVYRLVGRHGTKYEITHAYGTEQRQIMSMGVDAPTSAITSFLLSKCVLRINDFPVLGVDDVRDIPLADRRMIFAEIEKRRVGPKFREVTTKCPACDVEQEVPLSIAALFQW